LLHGRFESSPKLISEDVLRRAFSPTCATIDNSRPGAGGRQRGKSRSAQQAAASGGELALPRSTFLASLYAYPRNRKEKAASINEGALRRW
jgi:hypothetical protein